MAEGVASTVAVAVAVGSGVGVGVSVSRRVAAGVGVLVPSATDSGLSFPPPAVARITMPAAIPAQRSATPAAANIRNQVGNNIARHTGSNTHDSAAAVTTRLIWSSNGARDNL